jgi:ferrochelatase
MSQPPDHPPIPEPKIGVLLINLGTPDAPEARAVRRYLAEFLSDPRVVELPAIAWKPILHGFILRTRPRRSAEAYNQVWTNEGSPLAAIARRQAHALRERMGGRVSVHYAMRYGNPGIAAALGNMAREGCTRILAAPRRRPLMTPCSRRSPACACNRRCALCRLITTTRCTSKRFGRT